MYNQGNVSELLNEIGEIYHVLFEKYRPKPVQSYSIGGTFYGSTELRSSVGNHYEIATKVIERLPYSGSEEWDAGIKVGGAFRDFNKEIEEEFIDKMSALLLKKGFELTIQNDERKWYVTPFNSSLNNSFHFLEVKISKRPIWGTNWSLFCGTMVSLLDENKTRIGNFKREFINANILSIQL